MDPPDTKGVGVNPVTMPERSRSPREEAEKGAQNGKEVNQVQHVPLQIPQHYLPLVSLALLSHLATSHKSPHHLQRDWRDVQHLVIHLHHHLCQHLWPPRCHPELLTLGTQY